MCVQPALVAQLDARSTGDQEFADSIPAGSSIEIEHEIFSTVILSLQEDTCQFLVKEYAQILVNA